MKLILRVELVLLIFATSGCKRNEAPASDSYTSSKIRVLVAFKNRCGSNGFALVDPRGKRYAVFQAHQAPFGSKAFDVNTRLPEGVPLKAVVYPGSSGDFKHDASAAKVIGSFTAREAHSGKTLVFSCPWSGVQITEWDTAGSMGIRP